MDRLACVDVPSLALQHLLAGHPDWRSEAVAVVDADEATGRLLEVNARAWKRGLRPGMRYASALALDGRLRAGTVAAAATGAAVGELLGRLRRHSPRVEPSADEPGLFWLDATGLGRLYAGTAAWARAVLREVRGAGFEARIAVGFRPFATWALARQPPTTGWDSAAGRGRGRALPGVVLCESEDEERRRARAVRLEVLGLDPRLRGALSRLGLRTVGDFAALPAAGVRRRFGEQAALLHARARGAAWEPFAPVPEEEALQRSLLLDDPVTSTTTLLFVARRLLAPLLERLAATERAARGLKLGLHRSLRDRDASLRLRVDAAEPTLDEAVLVDLLRLRLESSFGGGRAGFPVIEVDVEVDAAPAAREQLRLFHERTRRDLAAAAKAIARLRAELGDDAVVRAVPRQGHLPEAGFAWTPMTAAAAPSPRVVLQRPLVRRIYTPALALPPRPFRERDDSWIPPATGPAGTHGRVEHRSGPYVVSGGWWNREIHREYHYAHTADGEVLWVYYDRRRRRWFLAGRVE